MKKLIFILLIVIQAQAQTFDFGCDILRFDEDLHSGISVSEKQDGFLSACGDGVTIGLDIFYALESDLALSGSYYRAKVGATLYDIIDSNTNEFGIAPDGWYNVWRGAPGTYSFPHNQSAILVEDGVISQVISCGNPPSVSLTVSSTNGGSVSTEAGTYDIGTTVTISATPNEGYEFSEWSNGATQNPLTITISEDFSITAIFSDTRPIISQLQGDWAYYYEDSSNMANASYLRISDSSIISANIGLINNRNCDFTTFEVADWHFISESEYNSLNDDTKMVLEHTNNTLIYKDSRSASLGVGNGQDIVNVSEATTFSVIIITRDGNDLHESTKFYRNGTLSSEAERTWVSIAEMTPYACNDNSVWLCITDETDGITTTYEGGEDIDLNPTHRYTFFFNFTEGGGSSNTTINGVHLNQPNDDLPNDGTYSIREGLMEFTGTTSRGCSMYAYWNVTVD